MQSNILTEIPHNSISTTDNVAYALQRGYNYLRAELPAEDVFSQHEHVSLEKTAPGAQQREESRTQTLLHIHRMKRSLSNNGETNKRDRSDAYHFII